MDLVDVDMVDVYLDHMAVGPGEVRVPPEHKKLLNLLASQSATTCRSLSS